ncbi:MAG: ImmA/IrrE family metallo-endopeptidase, partial [candidate division Zixibacteria bacterium]|nr:ImmA/IrrE family metallo-endopeptidase [candidate division Zixibacteria bacterium]
MGERRFFGGGRVDFRLGRVFGPALRHKVFSIDRRYVAGPLRHTQRTQFGFCDFLYGAPRKLLVRILASGLFFVLRKTGGRQRYTAAHELYHYLTGDRNERRANVFAAELLMPSFAVSTIWNEMKKFGEPNPWAVKLLSCRFAVSSQAAAIRIKELGL